MNMHRQNFIFNPMYASSNVSSQNTRQHHEEPVTDFGPIGGALRSSRQIQNAKVNEPLLLPSSTQQRQLTEGRKESKVGLNGDRLSSLHSKLHQEAEKIKQWKINTEIEMKEKERKMSEAAKTIESLRKSILELQFLNESVSSKLHEEKSQKEETTQKITTTRNMCNALKEHLVKLEKNVKNGENMLDVQKFENKQQVEQLQELVLKFQELEIQSNCKEHDMKKAIMDCEIAYKQEIENLHAKILESEECSRLLRESGKNYEDSIEMIRNELAQVSDELEIAKSNKNALQEKCDAANNVISAHEKTIEDLKNEKHILSEEAKMMQEGFEEKLSTLLNECEMLNTDITEKQNLLNVKDAELQERKQEMCNFQIAMQDKNLEAEQCKIKIGELCTQNLESKERLEQVVEENENLKAVMQEKESLLNIGRKKAQEIEQHLKSERELANRLKEKVSALEIEIENASKRKQDDDVCEAKIIQLQKENENLKNQIDVLMTQMNNDRELMTTLQQNNDHLCEDGKTMLQQIEDLKAEQEVTLKNVADGRFQLEQRNADLKVAEDQLQQLKEEIEVLRVQRDQQANTIIQEVESKEKKIEGAENKLKNMQSKLDNKMKQVSKLQAENKSMKAQLKVQQRINTKLENELTTAHKMAEDLQNESRVISEKSDQKTNDIMKDLEEFKTISESLKQEKEILLKDLQELGQKAESSRHQSEKAKKDMSLAKESFEAQITEMCTTLEKYKMENEKLMSAKEKELNAQAKLLTDTKKGYDENLKKRESQIETLKTTVESKDKKISELNNDFETMKIEIKDLKSKSSSSNIANNDVRKVNSPRTPRTPKTPQMSTPMTPQGILRVNEEKPARIKHVAFSMNDHDSMSDDEEDILVRKKYSPSVASNVTMQGKINSVRPIIRASPKLSASKPRDTTKSPENPGKRAKRVEAQSNGLNTSELEKFQRLFPDFEDRKNKTDSPRANKKQAFKSRVKKVIPKAKRDGKNSKMDLSWFDTDSSFGFNLEE